LSFIAGLVLLILNVTSCDGGEDPPPPGVETETCATTGGSCGSNATCVDLEPGTFEGTVGFYCDCNDGFAPVDGVCSDLDECTQGFHSCDMNATCTNTEGGYDCACNEGYEGDGFACAAPPMSAENIAIAGQYLMAYRALREAVIFGANDEALDLDDDGALSFLDIVAARCAAHAESSGELFPQLGQGCPSQNPIRTDRFLAMEAMTETECTVDTDCDGQSPGTARCTSPDATCRCLPIGTSGLSECQPQQP